MFSFSIPFQIYGWNYTFRIFRNLIIFSILYYGCFSARPKPCETGLCLPGTGNLLIGRENRLYASSTCGLLKGERYCIVTNLEDKKKCFWCDSTPHYIGSNLSHRIQNVVSKPHYYGSKSQKMWWQSQNGVENVTIQLDLEAEFYFTHLVAKFKTFRPAAMLVERSYDFGKTWKVYRYLAYDCNKYFPRVPRGPQSNLTVVYCDETYSSVTPITDGEVIVKILPTKLEATDPYSSEIQNLVKLTNLRINFTKLHTLGDDLLDSRVEIQEKYYYAIWDMYVGGSCSCYGHANRCVPQEGVDWKPDMVHGQCECTHNTKGLNCEKCDNFYNDLEWAPAVGTQNPFVCKRCNCNNHATSCHFDRTVFESTGRISGGVCDDCQHNTMGRNCEQCKHFFYQDPHKDFSSPDVCLKCDCDPAGSLEDGICDSRTDIVNGLVSGRCHCKPNVEGRRCDVCKNGFWNFNESNPYGCQACSCDIYGTYDNQGCNKETGECTCKRNVIGRNCNQCLPEYWGLGEIRDGCQPCDCDPGGSFDNSCDVISGQCRCRPNLTGRRCDVPDQGFFAGPLDFLITEAEVTQCHGTCQIDIREPFDGAQNKTWTGSGFVHVLQNSVLVFPIGNIDMSMEYYPVIRYEPQITSELDKVHMIIEEINATDIPGICDHSSYNIDTRDVTLSPTSGYTIISPPVCLEKGRKYNVRLAFSKSDTQSTTPMASILIDSLVLVPRIESIPFMHGSTIADQRQREFEQHGCADAIYSVIKGNMSDICKTLFYSIGVFVHGGAYPCTCNSMGSYDTYCDALSGHCRCKPNVIGRACEKCAPGTYGFSLSGCKACDCNSVGALDNFCDVYTGQCQCRDQTYGRVCDQCQPGSWNYPNCQRCICHGHADICDPYTGACVNCENYTEGHYCDRCVEGYYGDPRLDVNIPCRKCPCPGTVDSGHSYAKNCTLDPRNQDVICQCDTGYAGTRCDSCANNYYGNPEVPGGKCVACNCNNNVDTNKSGNCDPHTGKCLQCLFNTEGFNCEICKGGYYGDAIHQLCNECTCNLLGTDVKQGSCDRVTGQCPCLPNVIGLNCDQCVANHWKIASGVGCEFCSCDPVGSKSEQCNQYDGQCVCKPGFGGRQCDQCQTNYWGNPNRECYPCDCNLEGSATLQCHQSNGTCKCSVGIGGDKCDQCARGYLGEAPNCKSCGECFDNWDAILNDLKGQTDTVITAAMDIMKTGATGSYTKEFEAVEKKIDDIKQLLQNTTASSQQLKMLDKLIDDTRSNLMVPSKLLADVGNQADNITERVTIASVALSDLKAKANNLNTTAQSLKNNITKLQEGNVEGALHLTREAYDKSNKIKAKNAMTANTIFDAERQCKSTETLIDRTIDKFTEGLEENKKHLQQLRNYSDDMEQVIPSLNQRICDKGGNPCDSLCGGAGCGSCGGLSCDNGALTKGENALKFAKDAKTYINEKETKTGELFRAVTQAMTDSKSASEAARIARDKVAVAKNASEMIIGEASDLTNKLDKFLTSPRTTPANIKDRASEALKKNIELQPQEITDLAKGINDTISSLTDISSIIRDTTGDLNNAQMLKERADNAKMDAVRILDTAEQVVKALKDAEMSQKQADSAIQDANKNIILAKDDLSQIFNNTNGAQQKANSTLIDVSNLQERLKKLQTDFLKNDRDATEIRGELKSITDEIRDMQNKTFGLKLNYQQVSQQLNDHKKNSTEIRLAAQTLLEKAGQLSANVTPKLKELTESEMNFGEQEKQLSNITDIIDQLTRRMAINFEEVGKKFDVYNNCIN